MRMQDGQTQLLLNWMTSSEASARYWNSMALGDDRTAAANAMACAVVEEIDADLYR